MSGSVNRREFVAGAAGVVAGAGVLGGAVSSAHAAQFTGKIKLAAKFHMITDKMSVMDKFKMMADIGYDGVEPRTSDVNKTYTVREMLRAQELTGVRVHGVVNSSSPDLVGAIDLARSMGATSVLTTIPRAPKSTASYLKNYKETQARIRKAAPHAEKHDVHILVENVWASWLNEPMAMARYVDEIDSPKVGVYFDIGNNIRWSMAEHWIEVLGPRIIKLDVKEYSNKLQVDEGLRAGFGVEIGDGSVHWDRVREELAKLNYRGWATAEVRGGDRARLADVLRRMKKELAV
ncbi:MAG: sugar phosphate isomerase/epimerase family protein [Planctomycetota bacterium]|jgi:hexulose-6-phosphate isomerase